MLPETTAPALTARPPAAPPLALRLFGPFEARLAGVPLARLHSRKGQWLLALLTLRAGREVDRAWLAALLWPDSPEPRALANLRVTLNDLRHALESEAHRLRCPTTRTLRLDLSSAEADVVTFDAAIARGDAVAAEEAIALYRGPLLEGCAEEWAFQEREAREQAYLAALETLAADAMARGDVVAAERYLQRAVAADPLREATCRALMQALAAGGNYAGAIIAYRELRLRLRREINAEPDPETRALFAQIRAEARQRADHRRPTTDDRPPKLDVSSVGGRSSVVGRRSPEDTLAFLFTDVEGSSRLWEQDVDGMRRALVRHDGLLRGTIEAHGGSVFKTMGDQFCAAFATASEAVCAALAAQQALGAEEWGEVGALRVRMALHAGTVEERDGDYIGPPLNRLSRILSVGHGGQILLSLAVQQLAGEALPEGASLRDLGVHRLRDLQQPERLFQLVHPALSGEFPPLRSLEAFAHNLPRQLTSFIGRQREITELQQLLPTASLLTLTGAGGCGKTRLALQVAAGLLEEFVDGVWLVELAALSDPGLVTQTLASTLGLREEPGRSLETTLADYLRARSLLLVLDNCEHLLTACARLAESLLRACPRLKILASSREALGVAGEQTYRVPSLSLPDSGKGSRVEGPGSRADSRRAVPSPLTLDTRPSTLLEYEAIRLFVDRAVLSQSTFALTPANAAPVVEICRRLDGIPLAIELAAARVKALPVEQLVKRLDDRFRLLTGGSRTALPRQQTLRALIDWSYALLTEQERTLLRRLSVFSGGWTLEAAEAVCVGDGMEEWEVLELLAALVEKSLVAYEEREGDARYLLPETIRQYSRDRLLEAGEAEAVRTRHRGLFLQLAEEVERNPRGPETQNWLDRLATEHDNLRAALEWALADPDGAEVGLRLAAALGPFWQARGYRAEGGQWLARTLERSGGAPAPLRARALKVATGLAASRGDLAAVHSLGWESVTLFRELGDKANTAWALLTLGRWGSPPGKPDARSVLESSLALYREIGDTHGMARALERIGWAVLADGYGDLASARLFFEESLAIHRASGRKEGIAAVLNGLGFLAFCEGEFAAAASLLDESIALYNELESKDFWPVTNRGRVALAAGDTALARSLQRESLAACRRNEDRHSISWVLRAFAEIAVAEGQAERAARLLGAAEALRETIGIRPPPIEHTARSPSVAAARSALGEVAFATAWAEGRAMSLNDAIAYALEPD